jgi:release factor glutamine methyltransferase
VNIAEALNSARDALARKAVEDAPLEAEWLLRHLLKIDRTQLYLDLEKELSPEEKKSFEALIARRLNGEPSAYIVGHREFYGRDFYVNPHTLIPRPESELLVETALKSAPNHGIATIADIGTGCGAIAISLALEITEAKIYATDISPAALDVAKANCQQYNVTNVRLLQGDMLEPLPEPIDLIIANLPYVGRAEIAPDSFEPLIALDGGTKGTEVIAKLCRQAKDKIKDDGLMLLEVGQGQSRTITALLNILFPDGRIEVLADLSGIERVVSLSLSKARVAG